MQKSVPETICVCTACFDKSSISTTHAPLIYDLHFICIAVKLITGLKNLIGKLLLEDTTKVKILCAEADIGLPLYKQEAPAWC